MAGETLSHGCHFIFLVLVSVSLLCSTTSDAKTPSLDEIKKFLDKINKPSLKTIKSPDGDIIDCVDIHKQLAFDSPELKNHTIQVRPSYQPSGEKKSSTPSGAWQTWHLTGEQCPNGTIPIQRKSISDVLKFGSLADFGRKKYTSMSNNSIEKPDTANHEHAVAMTSVGSYWGTKASLNIWNPFVQGTNYFSLSQLWITSGSYAAKDLNTIEAGWQVYPYLWKGYLPRLFVYWTRNAYINTGCYNHMCAGFVQTNSQVLLGGTIQPYSVYNGNQYETVFHVWKDPGTKNWWLQLNGINVGYWPSSIFTRLNSNAQMVKWGGEIANPPSSVHTTTDMGSGHFPEEGLRKACFTRNLLVVNGKNQYAKVGTLTKFATKPKCYNINIFHTSDPDWGDYIFFGGSGKNAQCP